MVQSRKQPADIALTPDETPTQKNTRRRDGASGSSNRCANRAAGQVAAPLVRLISRGGPVSIFVCLCRNSALPNLAGAAAGDSTNRQAFQLSSCCCTI